MSIRATPPPPTDRIVLAREVAGMFGYSTVVTLMKAVKAKRFPPPIRISPTRNGWALSTLMEYLNRLKATVAEGPDSAA
jgi:predicted DNA-binding transcriptional regulator AlpA